MSVSEFQPSKKAIVAAVIVVGATYAYFLLFAQFGFLKALQVATDGQPGVMKPVMGVMGLAGITGSFLAAKIFTLERSRRMLVAGFAVSAAAAGLSLVGGSLAVFYLIALLVGLGVGLTTVTLAGLLRRVLGGGRLGITIGLGTGLAYGFCNLPLIFDAPPATQAGWALLIVAVGGIAVRWLEFLAVEERAPDRFDYSKWGVVMWVTLFFTLVGLDSAGFYIIQHTPSLKGEMWNGEWRLGVNAGMHILAAVLAGYALDRQWVGRTLLFAAALLVMACLVIDGVQRAFAVGALFYTAGVSVYSVALVFYPARSTRPGLAALVYAVAGWGGSALGIGFAENRHTVPPWFIATAGGVIAAALLARRLIGGRRSGGIAVGLALLVGAVVVPKVKAEDQPLIAQGRAIYISEGCIHCHSQYVRPGTDDEVRWGVGQSLEVVLAQTPPLLGNRRQGPDLQNVGNRRSSEWNRLHLMAPRTLMPGSRMPSYAYLFKSGRSEGGALLAYLDTLGGGQVVERWASNQLWQSLPEKQLFPVDQQRRLFGQWCASCHGAAGLGDGPAAAALANQPRNLVADAWRRIPAGTDLVTERLALARLIKFGVLGTAMAGHEYLDDDTVLSLATYLQTLRAKK